MAQSQRFRDQAPLILTVPGLNGSGPSHWQTRWEAQREDCVRVEMETWDAPHRNNWVNRLNLAIHRAERPVVLVAHSLGCLVTAWWAEYERPAFGSPVVGALLVAPPTVDKPDVDERLARFAPVPSDPLPFPSILVASRNDPYATLAENRRLAWRWGSQFADAGEAGHINADSGLGDWEFGRFLLRRIVDQAETGGELDAFPAAVRATAPGLAELAA